MKRLSLCFAAISLFAPCYAGAIELGDLLTPVLASRGEVSIDVAAKPGQTSSVTWDSTLLLAKIRADLMEHYKVSGDLVLSLARPWQVVNAASNAELVITEYPERGIDQSFVVGVQLVSDGKVEGKWQLGLRAQLWDELLIPTQRVNRGQSLDGIPFHARRTDLLRLHEPCVAVNAELGKFEALQTLVEDQPIRVRDIAPRPLVRKGEVVEVVATQGALSLTMKAQALENGGETDVIRLRNLDTHKEFNAQIIDESKVRVYF